MSFNSTWEQCFALNALYNERIDFARDAILQENFAELSDSINEIIVTKVRENKQFLNFIQLLVEKSHLDLLSLLYSNLESTFMLLPCQSVKMIRYSGSN